MQNTISRRTVLTTGAAAIAMAPASGALSAATEISAQLDSLIAACGAAEAAWKVTIDPLEDAEDAWKDHVKANPLPMVPYFGGALDAGLFDRDDMESQIREIFRRQREILPAFSRMDPSTAEAMAAVLRTQEAETLTVAHRMHDEIDRRKEEFGLTAAREAYHSTCDAHEGAIWALLEYRSSSLAEERARAAAILAAPIARELVTVNDRWADALLHSVAGLAVPNEEA